MQLIEIISVLNHSWINYIYETGNYSWDNLEKNMYIRAGAWVRVQKLILAT